MIDQKKLLILITSIVIYINFINYFHFDIQSLENKIALLSARIEQEKKLSAMNEENLSKNLQIPYDSLFFSGKRYNYSQAMGAMQNAIEKNAKGYCIIKKISWAQSVQAKTWYDRLKMDIFLVCDANNLFHFLNNLKKSKKLYKIENMKISKDRNHKILNIYMQIVAYRMK